jgi:archaellum component FlaC
MENMIEGDAQIEKMVDVIENIEKYEELIVACENDIKKDCKDIEAYKKKCEDVEENEEEVSEAYYRVKKVYEGLSDTLKQLNREYNNIKIYKSELQTKYDIEYDKIIKT